MKNLYLTAAVAAVLFTACAKDEQVAPDAKIAKLGFASITAEVMTRATTPLDAGFKFNLSASTDYAAEVAREVTYANSIYTITDIATSPIYVSSAYSRTLTAWTPSSKAPKAAGTPEFELTPGTAAIDFMYQPDLEITVNNCENVGISMKHAMAKITFEFSFPTGSIGVKNVEKLSLKGTPTTSTFNITTGKWTPAAVADLDIVPKSTAITAAGFSAMVVPMTAIDDTNKLTIECQVSTTVAALSAEITGLTKLEAGKNYVVTINVTDKSLSIGDVSQEDWADGGNGKVELI